MRKVYLVLALVAALCFNLPAFAADSAGIGIETFSEILEDIESLHLSKPDQAELLQGAVDGMIDSLEDPYTEYLAPRELEDFNDSINGNYAGVGIQLEPGEQYPQAVGTIKGTPAEKAGVLPGDLILKVDGVDTLEQPLGEVVQKIRGPEGTQVRLTIRRQSTADFELVLVRANINNPTVSWEVLADGAGYIRVNSFGNNTAEEFREALDGLLQEGADSLILDLRDNPGGLLDTAVQLAGEFLDPGQVVVSTADRDSDRKVYRTKGKPAAKGLETVVLVNQYSASASEILAGALQDYNAAILAGSRTYGKGTVQMVVPLEAGGALKLTIAEYRTPLDRKIAGTGLSPDYQVITPALQLLSAQRLLKPAGPNTLILENVNNEALVNGETVQTKQSMLQYNGTIYLPLRFALEALGYRVDWQAADSSVKVTGHGTSAVYCTGEGECTGTVAGAAPLLTKDGAVYIPLAGLGDLGINYRSEDGKVYIEKN
ncbi:MAG: putative CtpA-like serine protease [Pelotomaculum sp. PtaB.Bin104]|nr:MAG: putative CtpA-like serine protease [Pelotomaculum sp. PtaB.Bin104]